MAEAANLLVVDDDERMRSLLQKVLVGEGYRVDQAATGEEAVTRLESTDYDVVLTDIKMPGMGGMGLLRQAREVSPGATVIMMTAFGSVTSAVAAMKEGAYEYISKPFQMDEVLILVGRAVDEKRLRRELVAVRKALEERYGFGNIVGKSKGMQEVFELVRRVSSTPATVLIRGASGTGKELVARAIHFNGDRREHPFVPINCGALPEDLLESELFGHEKGAFTGAVSEKRGLFLEANGGSVFLDEISEMGVAMQAKLLRVLQEGEVRPVGGNRPTHVDVRVIAATNQDLQGLVRQGRFREDLYYRLNVIPIVLPGLRDRPEDIPLLAEHFVQKFVGETGSHKRLTRECLSVLVRYPWPGNVRELENAIERAVILTDGEEIGPEDLPAELRTAEGRSLSRAVRGGATLEDLDKDYILTVLDKTGGNQTRAAEILGIDRRTLYRKLQSYGRSDIEA